MASQLREVLNRFSDQSAPLSIQQMARDMQIEPGVLREMINYWVRKGKLREVGAAGAGCNCKACGSGTVELPHSYERVRDDALPIVSSCTCGCGGKH